MAFVDDRFHIILDTDHNDSYQKWRNVVDLEVVVEHKYVVQQLTQRKADNNFNLTVRPIEANANLMTTYLALHGAET